MSIDYTNAPLVSYLETALWSSTDNADDSGGAPLDDNYSIDDLSPESIAQAAKDMAAFLEDEVAQRYDAQQVAHDFWLTRNRHGAGFWDGGYPSADGKHLTDLAHAYGSVDIYVGDDGKLHMT